MTKLSVNINKLATLRNSRGKNNPDLIKTMLEIISFGANGITVHPRPDGRHIRFSDVYAIKDALYSSDVELNIEGYPNDNFLALIKDIKPAQCTLVPDPPHALTSNAGWDIENNFVMLKDVVHFLHQHGVRASLFIDPQKIYSSVKSIALLKEIGTDRVELYTEAYADNFGTENGEKIFAIYKDIAIKINKLGIGINAGHDLNLENLKFFVSNILGYSQHLTLCEGRGASAVSIIAEVSIGHALICDALKYGMQATIAKYLDEIAFSDTRRAEV